MEAAFLARVHVSNLYRLRQKLGAFQENGSWLIPRDNLNRYIANRVKKANKIVATVAAIEDRDS
jgi:hypothetical protein